MRRIFSGRTAFSSQSASADHHDQTKLYDGSGASDRSDPPIQSIVSRGKSFRNAFCLCVTMIPTGIALLYQFSGIFTGTNAMGEETGIAIGLCQSMEQLFQKHSFKYYHGNGIAHRRTFPESGI